MNSAPTMTEISARLKEILATVKPLAAEYYRLSQKPLGVTGEVAEYVAAELLGLDLVPARTAGYDAVRRSPAGDVRVQIKGRAFNPADKKSQRIGSIKQNASCDVVLLVLLDNSTLDPVEIWEAPYGKISARLLEPGSKARNERGALSVSGFKAMAQLIWKAGSKA